MFLKAAMIRLHLKTHMSGKILSTPSIACRLKTMNLREKLNRFYKKTAPEQKSDTRHRLDCLFKPRRVFLKQEQTEIESTVNSKILTSAHEGVLISEYESSISFTEQDNAHTSFSEIAQAII
jgi:hypothetical protein